MPSSPFERIISNNNRKKCLSLDRCSSLLSHFIVFVIGYQLGLATSIHWILPNLDKQHQSSSSKDFGNDVQKDNRQLDKTNDVTQSIPLSKSLNKIWYGAATVSRDDFIEQYDLGVPWDTDMGNTDVLLLYTSTIQQYPASNTSVHSNNMEWPPTHYQSAVDATSVCDHMKVILLRPRNDRECLAIVPQWESHHIHKFLRWKHDKDLANDDLPKVSANYTLKHVSREHTNHGYGVQIPNNDQTDRYLKMLAEYIEQYSATIQQLKPLLEKMFQNNTIMYAEKVGSGKNRRIRQSTLPIVHNMDSIPNNPVVIVMVCNFGQSELFLNFICNAQRKNLDISKVLLFATDIDMYELAVLYQHLLTVFFVNTSFGGIALPKNAAKSYGDRTFTGMMFSKVYCVHLINSLGYDVLFQDVDVIWYRNPITEFFNNVTKTGHYDIFFQDDGAHSDRYLPYSPNSGFYYVRNNARTRNFFSVFMRMGDEIIVSGSHQAAMNDLLADHSSSKGLRVKVFGRDSSVGCDFPGGYHFHKRPSFMKEILQKEKHPYIFHMSWTTNKENKKKFFEQFGEWHLQEACVAKTADDIKKINTGTDDINIVNTCCSLEPLIVCHYKDKPSKSSCNDSPSIDKYGSSFW